jgi:serine phosphatase RsbU (regulator of sigma subunit)
LLICNGSGSSREVRKLDGPGPPVGLSPDEPFPTVQVEIAPGSSLLIYSDGAIEIFIQPRKLWGVDGLVQFVRDHDMTKRESLDALQAFVKSTAGTETLADDFSTVLARFTSVQNNGPGAPFLPIAPRPGARSRPGAPEKPLPFR